MLKEEQTTFNKNPPTLYFCIPPKVFENISLFHWRRLKIKL